jgi:hypothetical protein
VHDFDVFADRTPAFDAFAGRPRFLSAIFAGIDRA